MQKDQSKVRAEQREARKRRVRRRVTGTPERPRLSVFRSLAGIYAQVIDDSRGHTLAAASTLSPELKGKLDGLKPVQIAEKVGELIAEHCKAVSITSVVFDRNGYKYHGRVLALADGARKGGLNF